MCMYYTADYEPDATDRVEYSTDKLSLSARQHFFASTDAYFDCCVISCHDFISLGE